MIKRYCDRCGKEIERVYNSRIPGKMSASGKEIILKEVDLCNDCYCIVEKTTNAYLSTAVRSRIRFYKTLFPELYKEEVTE